MTVVVVGFVVKWLLRMYEFLFLWWAWAEFLNFCFPTVPAPMVISISSDRSPSELYFLTFFQGFFPG